MSSFLQLTAHTRTQLPACLSICGAVFSIHFFLSFIGTKHDRHNEIQAALYKHLNVSYGDILAEKLYSGLFP